MNKGLKVLIVLTFVLVLTLTAFLMWKEMTRPQGMTVVTEEPEAIVVSEGRFLYKTPEEWKPILEKRYNELKSLLNKKDWAGVANLYGQDVVVHSKRREKMFKGGNDIAGSFWKKMFDETPGMSVVGFEIIEAMDVFPVDIPVKVLGLSTRLDQMVVYRGVLTTEASPAESNNFYGIAGHIQNCNDIFFGEIF